MALSVQKLRGLSACSLGFVQVANNGTPVPLSKNIDPTNVNAPYTSFPPPAQYPGPGTEWTPAMRGFALQGYHPGNNNNGMIVNTGNVYLMGSAAGGAGNRSDSGAMLKVIAPGADFFFPSDGTGLTMFSPYTLYLDADVDGEGALVTAFGGGNP